MKSYLCLLIGLFVATMGSGQNHDLDVLGRWDNDDLPVDDFQSFNDIWGWHDGAGREYAIMGSLDSTYFIEVTDPKNPIVRDVEAGKWKGCVHRDFKTYGKYCYGVADEGYSSLQIFDMSYLPDSVHKVYDSDEFTVRTHNIFIDGERLYLGTCTSQSDYIPMRVLSLEDPENPAFLYDLRGPVVGGKPLFREVHDLYARNDTVYCNGGYDGLFIYTYHDSTKKSNDDSTWKIFKPRMEMVTSLMRYTNQDFNHSCWVSNDGKNMVMQDEQSGMKLKMVRLAQGEVPEVLTTFGSNADKGSVPHNAFIHKKKVFVSYYHEGVLVYDISNPEIPKELARYDTYPQNTDYEGFYGCWGVYPFLPSGNIIASDQLNGLFIFSLATGIDEGLNNPGFSVYPNPASSMVQVELANESASWTCELYETTGRKVLGFDAEGRSLQIDVSDLAKGVYMLRLQNGGFEHTGRIIIR